MSVSQILNSNGLIPASLIEGGGGGGGVLTNAIVVGSSLGGQIAIEYAFSNQQNIEKLILVSPAGAMKQSTPALDAYIMAALYPDMNTARTAFSKMTGNNADVSQSIVDGFVQRMLLPNAKYAFM
mgnify:CR=1 FL=1